MKFDGRRERGARRLFLSGLCTVTYGWLGTVKRKAVVEEVEIASGWRLWMGICLSMLRAWDCEADRRCGR